VPLTVDCVVAAEYGHAIVSFIGKGLSHKVGANHIHQVTTEVTIEFSFSQKQREKCISISLPNPYQISGGFSKETVYCFFEN
jgi:hypothetical protein